MKHKLCENCKTKRATTKINLCLACWKWLKRHGRSRPRHLYVKQCMNCGKPKVEKFSKGRCVNCYQYKLARGYDRSQKVIDALTPLGWCDCGNAAILHKRVKIGRASVILKLCYPCAKLENG